jgi:hypothetical protein
MVNEKFNCWQQRIFCEQASVERRALRDSGEVDELPWIRKFLIFCFRGDYEKEETDARAVAELLSFSELPKDLSSVCCLLCK